MMRGEDRIAFGVIVTVENSEGRTFSLHRVGRDALDQACADALRLDPTFRVISISTPETIAADLAGHLPNERTYTVALPENPRLGRIGQMKMIHPRLASRREENLRKHRARGDSWE